MKKKTGFYTEFCYVLGIVTLAIGTAFMERADFGVSMVVAPAYLLHLRVSEIWSWFTFGVAEFTLQALILILMAVFLRRFKVSYLISFVTAVIYGFTLDACMYIVSVAPADTFILRIIWYIAGMLFCAVGVAFFFHTYIAPEAYELFVKEVSHKTGLEIHRFKTIYDCTSCLIAIILSFIFFGFGHFEGVKLGTIVCALINGKVISIFSHAMEKQLNFKDLMPWTKKHLS